VRTLMEFAVGDLIRTHEYLGVVVEKTTELSHTDPETGRVFRLPLRNALYTVEMELSILTEWAPTERQVPLYDILSKRGRLKLFEDELAAHRSPADDLCLEIEAYVRRRRPGAPVGRHPFAGLTLTSPAFMQKAHEVGAINDWPSLWVAEARGGWFALLLQPVSGALWAPTRGASDPHAEDLAAPAPPDFAPPPGFRYADARRFRQARLFRKLFKQGFLPAFVRRFDEAKAVVDRYFALPAVKIERAPW
ncbi:MAG: hypothetical protein RMM53_12135, partial [Bacteroidia bacterium]|nr:hypothetical protein [Bacteroidia bacterium]MDW8334955.1 hypothetical protein [Bacteroidia bacterium]